MGWWWSSAAPEDHKDAPSPSNSTDSSLPSVVQDTANTVKKSDPQPRTLSRDEQAEEEFATLLSELQADIAHERPIQSPLQALLPEPSRRRKPPAPRPNPDNRTPDSTDGSSEDSTFPSLYPTTMSCRDAFDYAWFCQSVGGQFVHGYRYGEWKNCRPHWADFFFCMRTKGYPQERREKMIRERYMGKELKFKTGPSCEDVWEARETPLHGQFQADWAELAVKEKEWEERHGRPPPEI